jgi:sulfonate transport system permease protein
MSIDVLDPTAGSSPPPAPSPSPVRSSVPKHARKAAGALRRLRRVSGLLAVLVCWQLGASRGLLGSTTPTPAQVLTEAVRLLGSGELLGNLAVSLVRVLKGLAIGLSIGLVFGLFAGLARLGEDIIDAPVQAVRMLPHLALVPLFIIWFGIGETSKVSLIAIGVIFPLYINVFHGIRGVDERLVESANKAHWDDYTGYLAKIGGYPPAITKATTLQSQVPDQPFTDTGLKLLDGTKTFLLQQKLIATDFTIDSWVAPGAKT